MALEQAAVAVRHLDAVEFWLATSLMLIVCLGGAFGAFLMLTRIRQIQDLPTSKIRSAAQGYVELEGIANLLSGEPVIAPLSRQPCAWWKYSVEEKRTVYSNGRRSSQWTTLEASTSGDLFELTDDTDACVVDPDGAKVLPNRSLTWYGNTRRPAGAPKKSSWIGFGRFRYHEETIRPGSALYALGWFRTEGGLAHNFDENAEIRELLNNWKTDQNMLLKQFDSDGDGQIDMQEWEQVRAAAIRKVRASQLERASNPDIHVLCQPPRRLRYILSTVPQDKLISRSRRYMALGFSLFLIGGCASVWLATVRGIL